MKVFISHDSRDKERFVDKFVRKLLNNGIDVWYDSWDLKLGDSLTDIFDAIPECDAFISIISKYSVNSNWVKAESDSAFVKRIEDKFKFIPIILMDDDLKIPNYLNHLLQCRIYNLNDYEKELNKIILDIYDISNKPKLRPKPKYFEESKIDSLEIADTIVIQNIGDFFMENDSFSLNFEKIVDLTKNFDLDEDNVQSSLEFLKDEGYIEYRTFTHTKQPHNIKFTYKGTISYCKHYIEDFDILLNEFFSLILNENIGNNKDLSKRMNTKIFIINALFDCLKNNGYIELYKTTAGDYIIRHISQRGQRYMKKMLESENDLYETTNKQFILPNCNKIETNMFKDLCKNCLESSFDDELDPLTILDITQQYFDEEDFNILQEKIAIPLKNLEKNNYITTSGGSIGMAFTSKSITSEGFCIYFNHFIENHNEIYCNIISSIVNDKETLIKQISDKLNIKYSIVEAIVKIFWKKGYISCKNDLTIIDITFEGEYYFQDYLIE